MKSIRGQRSGRAARSDNKRRSKAAARPAVVAAVAEASSMLVENAALAELAPPVEAPMAVIESVGVPAESTTEVSPPISGAESGEPRVQSVAADTEVRLPASCTLRDAADLKTVLMPHVDVEQLVRIDVSAVERIDAAAIQVLTSFVRGRLRAARMVEWSGLNAAFTDAVNLLGLGPQLHIAAQARP